jgi:glutamate-1-semialdehyde 2,1-aminomutase
MRDLEFIKAKGQYLYSKNKKYLDFCMSNGAMILGHSNKIFKSSVEYQKNYGSNYSYKNTNNEKFKKELKKSYKNYVNIQFCNSGSEANIRALRVVRAITGRKKFAMINGSWHGSVDNFMFDLNNKNQIVGKGGSNFSKDEIIMLEYNNIRQSLNLLRKNKKKISGLIVEPIQASCPTIQSENYIKSIYNFCKKNKIYIIFDEIITGLRTKKLSVCKKLNVVPDIITFAKIFGGGLPIGICCIEKKLNKKIDKLDNKIFFGGTFSGNPFSSIVGLNTFKYIKENESNIFHHIEMISNYIEKEINLFCKNKNLNFRIQRYYSILRPIFSKKNILNKKHREIFDPNLSKTESLRRHLLKNFIFIGKNGAIFISLKHNMNDAKKLVKVITKYLSNKTS